MVLWCDISRVTAHAHMMKTTDNTKLVFLRTQSQGFKPRPQFYGDVTPVCPSHSIVDKMTKQYTQPTDDTVCGVDGPTPG